MNIFKLSLNGMQESLRPYDVCLPHRSPTMLICLRLSYTHRLEFQRLYTPSAFREERILWRAVIQLNLVRSVRKILDALSDYQDTLGESLSGNEGEGPDNDELDDQLFLSSEIQELKMRLLPLRHIEQLLIAKLVPPGEDEATHFGGFSAPSASNNGHTHSHSARANQEIFVRPGTSWKGFVARGKGVRGHGRPLSVGTAGIETQDEPTAVLHECRYDLMSLWQDPAVREILRRRKIRLEEQPGL